MNNRPTRPFHTFTGSTERERENRRPSRKCRSIGKYLSRMIYLFIRHTMCARPLLIPISFSIFQANVICHTYPSLGREIEEGKQLIYYWIYYYYLWARYRRIQESYIDYFRQLASPFSRNWPSLKKPIIIMHKTIEPCRNGHRRRSIRCEKGNRIFMDRI